MDMISALPGHLHSPSKEDEPGGVGHGASEAALIDDLRFAGDSATRGNSYARMIVGLALLGAIESRRKARPTQEQLSPVETA
jgi:hypothetical protein